VRGKKKTYERVRVREGGGRERKAKSNAKEESDSCKQKDRITLVKKQIKKGPMTG